MGFGGSRQGRLQEEEQLSFPGMGPSELPDPNAVVGQARDSLQPPSYADAEPMIFKGEGGELSPFQKIRLDAQRAEVDQLLVDNEIKMKRRAAKERDRDENRRSELETARWDRFDRRVERYVYLGIFLLAALVAIAMGLAAPSSGQGGLAVSPGGPVAVAVLAGLRLRALGAGGRTSIWDWLIRRQDGR